MVFSYYLSILPYSFTWYIAKVLGLQIPIVFYCGDPLDHYVFSPVARYLGSIPYVTDKPHVKSFLKEQGIVCKSMPVFPKVMIMARHSAYKFPCQSIVKIGLRHGAYHFKKMTSAQNYNQFDLYLMTSEADVKAGQAMGVRSAVAVGYPKLDPAFNGEIDQQQLDKLRQKLKFDVSKPVVMFSATYVSSGMSAISAWCNNLSQLTDNWNVMVTLHPWIKLSYREKIKTIPKVVLINDYDTLPYLMLADVVVGDTSSILADACALNKTIVTFQTIHAKRSLPEISEIIDSISYKVRSFGDLKFMLKYALEHPDELADRRSASNQVFFDRLDGNAGERAAAAIKKVLPAEVRFMHD